MFLEKLSDFADQIGLPPPLYQPRPFRYTLRLASDGTFEGVTEHTDAVNKRGMVHLAPHSKRTVAITPLLLADTVEYTLGVVREDKKPERVAAQHAAYVELVQTCAQATQEPAVEAVARFLMSADLLRIAEEHKLAADANVFFQVDDVQPIDLPKVQRYWATRTTSEENAQEVMQCLVCGEMRPPVKRLPIVIKGIPGGQSGGLTLISANEAAFESYMLEASLIAPTCEACGERFGNALNSLLREPHTHMVIPPLAYVFWVRDPIANMNLPNLLQAESGEVKQLLKAHYEGKRKNLAITSPSFYAAALSASGSRVVLRDWIETTLADVQAHLAQYFRLQRICDASGEPQVFPLWQLINATVNKKSKEQPLARVGQLLLHAALRGGVLPDSLLYSVIRRTQAEHNVQSVQAALIKMILLSQETLPSKEQGDHDMTTVNEECKDPAYLCGRLLAQLNSIQWYALGDINATIVDRYYGTASTAPASVFGRLLRGVQPHLATIRQKSGARRAFYLDRELATLLNDLKEIPTLLTLKQQGLFALGYYHQKVRFYQKGQDKASDDKSEQSEGDETPGLPVE